MTFRTSLWLLLSAVAGSNVASECPENPTTTFESVFLIDIIAKASLNQDDLSHYGEVFQNMFNAEASSKCSDAKTRTITVTDVTVSASKELPEAPVENGDCSLGVSLQVKAMGSCNGCQGLFDPPLPEPQTKKGNKKKLKKHLKKIKKHSKKKKLEEKEANSSEEESSEEEDDDRRLGQKNQDCRLCPNLTKKGFEDALGEEIRTRASNGGNICDSRKGTEFQRIEGCGDEISLRDYYFEIGLGVCTAFFEDEEVAAAVRQKIEGTLVVELKNGINFLSDGNCNFCDETFLNLDNLTIEYINADPNARRRLSHGRRLGRLNVGLGGNGSGGFDDANRRSLIESEMGGTCDVSDPPDRIRKGFPERCFCQAEAPRKMITSDDLSMEAQTVLSQIVEEDPCIQSVDTFTELSEPPGCQDEEVPLKLDLLLKPNSSPIFNAYFIPSKAEVFPNLNIGSNARKVSRRQCVSPDACISVKIKDASSGFSVSMSLDGERITDTQGVSQFFLEFGNCPEGESEECDCLKCVEELMEEYCCAECGLDVAQDSIFSMTGDCEGPDCV